MANAAPTKLRVSALCLAGSAAVFALTVAAVWSFPFAIKYLAFPSALAQVALALVATVIAFRHPVARTGRSALRIFCTVALMATGAELLIVLFIRSVLRGFSG